jgi:multidrug resistance efflux pump
MKLISSLCLILLATGVVAASDSTNAASATAEEVSVRGELFYSVERQVTFPYGGTVTELAVDVGQEVARGDVLLRYSLSPRARMELAEMASAAPLLSAQAEQAVLEDEHQTAGVALLEAEQMARDKMGTKAQVDRARRKVELLHERLVAARHRNEQESIQYGLRVAWVTEVTGSGGSAIPETVALTAPIAGTVVWVSGDCRPGAEVQAGAPAMMLGVMDPMIIRAHVHELDVVKLSKGDRADITLLTAPGRMLEGSISRIAWAPFPHWLPEPSYFEIELTVPNPDRQLKKGYKANLLFRKGTPD